jgi:phage-related minor tail protein
MADEIQLKVSADIKEVNSAITATKKFEKQITNTVKALNAGKITNKAYNQSLLEIKRGYQEYSTSSQKATADVRKMANAIKEAEDAAKQQELAKAAIKNTQELNRLKMGYDKVYAAEQKRLRLKKLLRAEVAAGNMTLRQAGTELLNYRNNLNQVNGALGNTRNRMNANGMAVQQAGYQVGDFVVQIQSGTNAWVAAGQQLTQLTGVIGMLNPAYIGLGATLGVIVPIITAVGAAISRNGASAKKTKNELDALGQTLSSLEDIRLDSIGKEFAGYAKSAKEEFNQILDIMEQVELKALQKTIQAPLRQVKAELQTFDYESAIAAQMGNKAPKFESGLGLKSAHEAEYLAVQLLRLEGQTREELQKQLSSITEALSLKGLLTTEVKQTISKLSQELAITETIKETVDDTIESEKAGRDAATAQQADLQKNFETRQKWHKWRMRSNDKYYANAQKLAAKAREDEIEAAALVKKTHSEEKARLVDKLSIASAEYFSLKNADEGARIEKVKADIARRLFIESREALGITGAKLQAEIGLYDAVQKQLGLNKDLTEEMAKQLALKNAIVSKTRGNLEGLGIIEGSTVSKEFYDAKRAAELRAEYQALGKEGPKGKEPTTMEGPIKALERQIELSKALFGLEGDARREQEVYMQLKFQNQDADIKAKESQLRSLSELVAEEERRTRVFEEQIQAQKDLADSIANSMGDALTSIVDGTKSVSDAFKDMARAIIAELYQIYVVKQITGMISRAISPYMPTFIPSENGNVFSNGNLVPYADGGVVGGPTYFPMNDGRTGLMGEAGPEAIMPLKRGKDGKLGVQAEGGSGGGDVIIHQNFNFQANGDESVKKIIAQQAPAIANMTKKQILDDRRRGGQMKQAFG